MSLPEIQTLVASIQQDIDTLLPRTLSFFDQAATVLTKSENLIDNADTVFTQFRSIERSINHIENLLTAALVVSIVTMVILFTYWFFTHVWPMLAGQHKHKHDLQHVLRDLGTAPVRVESMAKKDF